jgi:hypothetical protein
MDQEMGTDGGLRVSMINSVVADQPSSLKKKKNLHNNISKKSHVV